MSATPVPVPPDGKVNMTKAELEAMLTSVAEKALGDKFTDLAPLNQKQMDLMTEMLEIQKRAEYRDKPAEEKGLMFARQARAMFLGNGDPERAVFEVKKRWGSDDPVLKGLEGTVKLKNLTVGSATGGGNIVIPEWSREWIELLRNQTVVRGLAGIRVLPMPVGAITLRKQGTAGTAYYVGESLNITKSDQTVNTVSMIYKKLAALTVVSNDLLRFAGPEADAFVRDDLLLVSALREDLAFLLGDGTSNTPVGILNWMAAGNKFASAGTSLANTQTDLAKAIRKLQEGNVPLMPSNGHWVMAPRTYWGIFNLTSTTGNYIFRDELQKGLLMGYPIHVTNQVPIVGSSTGAITGGAASFLFFVHAPSCLIGDSMNVQVDIFQNGTYYDGSVVVSGISTDETVIRVLREHDFALRHDVGASVVYNETIA
jgi:HK97 family phage major capsid protein